MTDFLIKIFTGTVEVARVIFSIGPRADLGRVEYTGSDDPGLDAIMGSIVRRQTWDWSDLAATLRESLTMTTGGRYIPRFHETPVSDGRGGDEVLRRCFRRRASV